MGNNDVYSRYVNAMRKEGSAENGFDLTTATVTSVDPVSISYNNVRITSGIVMSGCLQSMLELEAVIDADGAISSGLKGCLKEAFKALQLATGDTVVVPRVKNKLCITGKGQEQ